MWDRLTCVEPGKPAVDLEAAKEHLRVDDEDQDALIEALVAAAQACIDGPQGIGVVTTPSTWRLSLDAFEPVIELKLGPVTSVVSIEYVDQDGSIVTLAPSAYLLDLGRRPARLVPAYGKSWPAARCQPGAVRITFEAGEATPPADLCQAIKLLVGHWFEHPEAVGPSNLAELPFAVRMLLTRRGIPAI